MTVRGTANLPATDGMVGRPVLDADGGEVGSVDGLYVDPQDGSVKYLAIETGWFAERRHVIPIEDVTARGSDPDKEIVLPYSRQTLSLAPTFAPDDDITIADESDVQEHFGLESYRDVLEARQTTPAPTPEIAEAEIHDALRRGEDPLTIRTKRWGM